MNENKKNKILLYDEKFKLIFDDEIDYLNYNKIRQLNNYKF